jgi:hypothetical protein
VYDNLTAKFNTLALNNLSALCFKANATRTATNAEDRIIYNTQTGGLSYHYKAMWQLARFSSQRPRPIRLLLPLILW